MRYIKSYNNTADLRTDLAAGELGHPYVAKVNNTIDFNSISTDWENEYFTIIALTDGTIRYNHKNGSNPMFLSINEGEWIETTSPLTIPVSKNDMIRFKSNRGNRAYDNNKGTFTSEGTAQFAVAGNLMSLVAGDGFATYVPYTSATGSNGDLYRSFRYFFKNCTGLISAKNLIIKYCDNDAFREFFNGCTNLLMPPELPANTMAKYCYQKMFYGCTSLTTAPVLPATTLEQSCYQNMFNGCKSLTTAPELPATNLANYCYQQMFYGCTSLTTAPKLPSTTLANSCYSSMFYGTNVLPDCSNIDFASSTVVASGGLKGLFSGTKVTDNDLERLLPKNDNGRYYLPATTLANGCYQQMFKGCKSLTTAPALPATILADSCYSSMFSNCTSLTTAPELPSTTLANSCYLSMFSNTNVLPDCSNIDFASSTVVASGGLKGLFSGTKVTDNDLERLLPKNDNGRYYLPVITLTSGCYYSMFMGCTSLTAAPALPATTLANNCYQNMFMGCKSLTTAPELPATTLANNCYDGMFWDCSSLNYIKCLATNISADRCTNYWVSGVASTGTFVKNSNMTSWTEGNSGIPTGWTVIDA